LTDYLARFGFKLTRSDKFAESPEGGAYFNLLYRNTAPASAKRASRSQDTVLISSGRYVNLYRYHFSLRVIGAGPYNSCYRHQFGTSLAIPGWTSYVTASLTILFVPAILLAGFALFQLLNLRNLKLFVPALGAAEFVADDGINLQFQRESEIR
jgi:hypothetical protein